MSEVVVIREKTSFMRMLVEFEDRRSGAEEKLKQELSKYTFNTFNDSVWTQIIEGQRHVRKANFGMLSEYDTQWTYLAKLWVIMESKTAGKLFASGKSISHFFKFLYEQELTPKNINKKTLLQYQAWLESRQTKKGCLRGRTKWGYYDSALRFLSLLQGHPWVATISNVSIMQNPYPPSNRQHSDESDESERYGVISDDKLKILDEHFSQVSVPLHYKINYWLMRLYGARPMDVPSYPLECVKQLSADLGTMITYVGKQGGASNKIDDTVEHPYKMEFLKLDEPMQKMLFNLIEEQQIVAKGLQDIIEPKGFLLTYSYKNVSTEGVTVLSHYNFHAYWRETVYPYFAHGDCPLPKSLKHTAISKRAVWGKFSHAQLRDVANHQSFDSLNNYVKPSKEKRLGLQERILMREGKLPEYGFKGNTVYDINNVKEKIMSDPSAHELPGWGWCSDASSCGNHFFCLGCECLVPNKKLTSYYFRQAEDYLNRADKLTEMGKHVDADDRMTTATQFYSLYLRSFEEGMEIDDGEE